MNFVNDRSGPSLLHDPEHRHPALRNGGFQTDRTEERIDFLWAMLLELGVIPQDDEYGLPLDPMLWYGIDGKPMEAEDLVGNVVPASSVRL